MATPTADARVLLAVGPDQYVADRTRLVKQARADGDKATAAAYQALKRPSVALWAALAAAEPGAVQAVISTTSALADIQAGGSDSASLSSATQTRRKALEDFVGAAVNALGKFDRGADRRRPEIRTLVDQLSRHPELADAWIDATLRELPDSEFGFGVFDDADMSAPAEPVPAKKKARPTTKKQPREVPEPTAPPRDLAAERAARAKRVEAARQAKRAVSAAARDLAAAERRLDAARHAVNEAQQVLRDAEAQHAAAEHEHEQAVAHEQSLH